MDAVLLAAIARTALYVVVLVLALRARNVLVSGTLAAAAVTSTLRGIDSPLSPLAATAAAVLGARLCLRYMEACASGAFRPDDRRGDA